MAGSLKVKPTSTLTSGKAQAKPKVSGLADAVRERYRRELRLRRVHGHARNATDAALLEAVRAGVAYERLARAVVAPALDGDAITRVRKERRKVAECFRKRVERADKRHALQLVADETTLSAQASNANDTIMQDPHRPLYIRETFYSEDVLPPDVARPAHPEDDDDDHDELDGPDVGDDDEDDDDLDE